mgnify:CR=1 FL=1
MPKLSGSEKQSLPLRERGLKFHPQRLSVIPYLSLPLRERGLKLTRILLWLERLCRSPCGSVD